MLPTISSTQLAKIIQIPKAPLIVIDVRDEDIIGGHIPGSINIPSKIFHSKAVELAKIYSAKEFIVFHCMQSKNRDPICAQILKTLLPKQENILVLDGGFEGWVVRFHKTAPHLIADFNYGYWKKILDEMSPLRKHMYTTEDQDV